MWGMSEGSLPPFGIPGAVPEVVRRAFGRLFGRTDRRTPARRAPDPALEARAGSAVGRHAGEHATLFERAERLAAKARRLEEAGTPSESASNRAARAWEEVGAGLDALRGAFVAAEGEEGGKAFDREVGLRYPALAPHGRAS